MSRIPTNMKRYLFLTLLLLTSCSVFCQDLSLRIDTLLNAYAKAMAFSGSVLVADHGEVLSNKGYGFKNISEKTMNDSNTVFQIEFQNHQTIYSCYHPAIAGKAPVVGPG